MKPYTAQPFTNDFGQVIQPGDKVIVITQGRSGSINQQVGIYLGYREYTRYYSRDKPSKQVVCEVERAKFGKWLPNGRQAKWATSEYDTTPYSTKKFTAVTSLWDNRVFPFA